MWDTWAFPMAATRLRRLSRAHFIYGMDIRVSRCGDRPTGGPGQPARSTFVPVPENRRPSSVAVTLSSLMVDGIPSIVRS